MNNSQFQSKEQLAEGAREFNKAFQDLEQQVGKAIVGMNDVVRLTLAAIFGGGHVLLEGVPGLGKTLLVKSLARVLGLTFKRIQFTPDLMPSDVTGTQVLTEDDSGKRRFVFKPGPVFSNLLLADEINRATPKTQSALLEAMEERQVTVLDETHKLPAPFFVLATQNPVELEGTYPLPEAQLDRFMLKLLVPAPSSLQLKEILTRTTGTMEADLETVFPEGQSAQKIQDFRNLVRCVVVADPIYEILVRMISALTPTNSFATDLSKRYVRFGPGPRGSQSVILAAKVHALLDGRFNLSFDDIKAVFLPALRHRLILNFQAEADSVSADTIIEQIRNAK